MPVGTPVLGELAVTVAVKVTEVPEVDGFSDEVTAVEVAATLTVTVAVFVVALPRLFVKTAWKYCELEVTEFARVYEVLVAPLMLLQLKQAMK